MTEELEAKFEIGDAKENVKGEEKKTIQNNEVLWT